MALVYFFNEVTFSEVEFCNLHTYLDEYIIHSKVKIKNEELSMAIT